MKYLKHYWISVVDGGYCCHENKIEKRHPEAEFPGLDVRYWMHDANGVDVCLSAVPDSTSVNDIFDVHDNTFKVVQVLTKTKFDSVANPMTEASSLSQQAKQETDEAVAADLQQQADAKFAQATAALHAL